MVGGAYHIFYDTYAEVQFSTKHMSEYVRFLPNDIDRLLEKFFDDNN